MRTPTTLTTLYAVLNSDGRWLSFEYCTWQLQIEVRDLFATEEQARFFANANAGPDAQWTIVPVNLEVRTEQRLPPPMLTLYYVDSIDTSTYWSRNWFLELDQAEALRTRLIEEDEFTPVDAPDNCANEVLYTQKTQIQLTPAGVLWLLTNLPDPNAG